MGSKSDLDTMRLSSEVLRELNIPHETKIISAHRTPEAMFNFARKAKEKGIKIIIAGAGGAAHLPGMVASLSELPVIGVPIKSSNLNGLDSLLSIVQMPKGVPVATVAIGQSGAENSASFCRQPPQGGTGLGPLAMTYTSMILLSPAAIIAAIAPASAHVPSG